MPLYIGDYLADTQHLTAYEHGAYLLLLMHQWQTGKLPGDDELLARIARVHPPHWRRVKSVLIHFFDVQEDGSWVQKRLALEITKSVEISNKRKDAALQKHSKSKANAVQLHTQSQSQSQLQRKKEEDAPTAHEESDEVSLFKRGKEILGQNSGGLISKLLAQKNKNIALARAALEMASTKSEPREYIGAILRGQPPDTRTARERGYEW
jgi:uncharacterized protein YdaU (DUF1376 family)